MLHRALAGVGLAAAIALAGPAGAQGSGYFSAPFSETTHTPTFGQAPVFVPHSEVPAFPGAQPEAVIERLGDLIAVIDRW